MSDDDLENDDLEVGDEDETEEGLEAAAEDVAEDDGGDSARSDRQRQSQGCGIGR